MSLVYRGLAPELGLFGLHTRFFSFDEGCSIGDCVPKDSTTSTESTTVTDSTTITDSTTVTDTTTSTTVTDGTTSINAVHLYLFYLIIICLISLMN